MVYRQATVDATAAGTSLVDETYHIAARANVERSRTPVRVSDASKTPQPTAS